MSAVCPYLNSTTRNKSRNKNSEKPIGGTKGKPIGVRDKSFQRSETEDWIPDSVSGSNSDSNSNSNSDYVSDSISDTNSNDSLSVGSNRTEIKNWSVGNTDKNRLNRDARRALERKIGKNISNKSKDTIIGSNKGKTIGDHGKILKKDLNKIIINCDLPTNCCQRTIPKEDELTVIPISQEDFNQGTYRIRKSARYILKQNILFAPRTNANAPPGTGWFAAMTIETSDVIIDLNGNTLEVSAEFLQNHIESIFAIIELGNSPFPGDIDGDGFGVLGTAFPSDDRYCPASNVIIQNGVLKRSTHWGIHGNNNSNIILRNLIIRDWEVAGISINAFQSGHLKDIEIIGCEHQISVRSILTSIDRTQHILQNIIDQNQSDPEIVEEAMAYLSDFNNFYKNRPNLFRAPIPYPDGAGYGVLITNGQGTNLVLGLPLNRETLDQGQIVSNGYCPHCIKLENVQVRDLNLKTVETVAIGSLLSEIEPYGHVINLAPLGFFGVLRWSDAFDSKGAFNPNPFIRAQAYAAFFLLQEDPEQQELFPENILEILQALIRGSERLFFENAQPIFGRNFTLVENKGAFGFRIDCSSHVIMTQCSAQNIVNYGEKGATLATIPGGNRYTAKEMPRYIGNDVRGFEFSVAEDLRLVECLASKCVSQNGDAFGFDLMNETSNVIGMKCIAREIVGNSDLNFCRSEDRLFESSDLKIIELEHSTNLPSEAYGFRVQNNTGPVYFFKSEACHIRAPRFALGFVSQSTGNVFFRKCQAHHIEATSSNLNGLPKRAFGYLSEKTYKTSYSHCVANRITISGEVGHQSLSPSMAIGFGLTEDQESEIIGSSVSYIRADQGRAIGILINESEASSILRNIIAWCGTVGFGIIDKSQPCKSAIVNNLLFGIRNEHLIAKPMPPIKDVTIESPSQHTVLKNKNTNIIIRPSTSKDFNKFVINNLKDRWILNCGDVDELSSNNVSNNVSNRTADRVMSRHKMESHDITKSLAVTDEYRRKTPTPKELPPQPPRPKSRRAPMANVFLDE
jgi:hypothetical protein